MIPERNRRREARRRFHGGRAARIVILALWAALLVVATAPAAIPCLWAQPPSLDELIAEPVAFGEPVTGVFEVEHIAYAPNIFLRSARSISVVTRYWGEEPPNLGRVTHGEFWLGGGSSCGNGDFDLGAVVYTWTNGTAENRGQFSGIKVDRDSIEQRLTPQQEMAVTAAFGPAVDVGPSLATQVVAWAQVWWLPGLLGAAAGWGIVGPLRRHLRKHVATARRRFYWPPLAFGAALALMLPVANRLHEDVSFDLGTAPAVLLMLAVAAATALSPPLTGSAAAVAALVLVGSLRDNFGRSPFRGVTFAADRFSYGAFLLFLGLGILAMSGRHWARRPGAAALLIGTGAVGSAVWPLAGRVSWGLIVPTTLVPMALAAWSVWAIRLPGRQDGAIKATPPAASRPTGR